MLSVLVLVLVLIGLVEFKIVLCEQIAAIGFCEPTRFYDVRTKMGPKKNGHGRRVFSC